jgi:mono/diheme cytochrome c family protein
MNRKIDLVSDLGETLFKTNCVVCHRINQNNCGGLNIINAYERWQDKKLFKDYIRNSQLVREKNEYVKQLWLNFGRIEKSHDFPKLTDTDINALIVYLELKKHKKG